MANIFIENYGKYANTEKNFEIFHNKVINMPRANFSELNETIKLLKSLASYIDLLDICFFVEPHTYKEIYKNIFVNYKNNILPKKNRSEEFENRFLNREEDFDFLYSDDGKLGRLFRHYMEYFAFFGMIKDEGNRKRKILDRDALQELILSPENVLKEIFRNKMLNININSNDFIKNISGISINEKADYRPAKSIISYCNEMNRPCTAFEIAILFGIIDEVQDEKSILCRAINIGKTLPENLENQKKRFFGSMGWKNEKGELFEYSASQNPDFKFKPFLLFMNVFGLIEYNDSTKLITLTEYSKNLAKEDIPFEMLDLQQLLTQIDDDKEDSNKLMDIILRKRNETITKAIQSDSELVFKINKRSIRNPIIKNNKRKRSRFIAEIAKIKCNYLDEVTKSETFEDKNGRNYVEAHHIIEFSTENGPDITDNLICLGPHNHSLTHHGSTSTVNDFYLTCQTRGVLTLDRFKAICTKYNCLTKQHVMVLLSKKIISKIDAEELNKLIDENGVDPLFLKSLNIQMGR